MQPSGTHGGEVMYFGLCLLSGELGFLNCDDVCMFELLEFVFNSVYVDLQYDEISLTFTAGSLYLFDVCSHVVVFGLSVRLSWYPMWMRGCYDCDVCTVGCVACVYAERLRG